MKATSKVHDMTDLSLGKLTLVPIVQVGSQNQLHVVIEVSICSKVVIPVKMC
jgi:hypothetical protein